MESFFFFPFFFGQKKKKTGFQGGPQCFACDGYGALKVVTQNPGEVHPL